MKYLAYIPLVVIVLLFVLLAADKIRLLGYLERCEEYTGEECSLVAVPNSIPADVIRESIEERI